MLIKVPTNIIIEVEDTNQAEEACHLISRALANELRSFPEGDVIDADAEGYEEVSEQEAKDNGWTE